MKHILGFLILFLTLQTACGGGAGDGFSVPADASSDAVTVVDTSLTATLKLSQNFGLPFHDLYRANLVPGLKSGVIYAVFFAAEDTNRTTPIFVTEVAVADKNIDPQSGYSVLTTSFENQVKVLRAPLGSSCLQFVVDTELRRDSLGESCDSATPETCLGNASLLQTDTAVLESENPAASCVLIDISKGEKKAVGSISLGHVYFNFEKLKQLPAGEEGRVLVSASNGAYRNAIKIVDLQSYSLAADSYVLQNAGSEFFGDVCGFIAGDGPVYAIGVHGEGVSIFPLDPTTGLQTGDAPLFIPEDNTGMNPSWPCRGVFVKGARTQALYLIQFKGAGSLATSSPHVLTSIIWTHEQNINQANVSYYEDLNDSAWRSIVASPAGDYLIALDNSWSTASQNNDVYQNRLIKIPVFGDNTLNTADISVTTTSFTAEDTCDGSQNYPAAVTMVRLNGVDRLLMGHDTGVAVYDTNFNLLQTLDLTAYGRLFTDFKTHPTKALLYALPTCKALSTNSELMLPYGSGYETADQNLVAILDTSGDSLKIATTEIDLDDDGDFEGGIDLDFFGLKKAIRSFDSTASLPPVVYTGPHMLVTENALFVRGSGVQGDLGEIISSSGMGQVQDMGLFDLATGHGLLLTDYNPFFEGVSSNAGRDAVWGFDFEPEVESSTGAFIYLP